MCWIANLLLIISIWRVGHKDRYAFLFGIAGSGLWGIEAYNTQQWALLFIELVLGYLQLVAWIRWGKK